MVTQTKTKGRVITYIVVTVVLSAGYLFLYNSTWVGNKQIHSLMELTATLLATFVGVLALVRYYTKKSNYLLFLGAGFLGTAFLDGYHTIVTSTFFDQLWSSPPESLIPWSWNASRTYLSILMVLSWWAWKREERLGEQGRFNERSVYIGIGLFTIASFLFFLFYPLPRAYYPEYIFGRPEEFISAFFFLLALTGYLKKGYWRNDHLDHWIVISLIVGFMGQAMFMSTSFRLFDVMFDAAHTLKKVSYICVLIGLLYAMYSLFRQAETDREQMEKALEETEKTKEQAETEKIVAEESRNRLKEALREVEASKKELEETNDFMVDREIKMKELKRQNEELRSKLCMK